MEIQEIKNYMKQKKISYAQLASMTGLSVSTITKIFGGFAKYPRVDTMQAIERALGIDTITPAERAAGIVDTVMVAVTADEDELLTLCRELCEKRGPAAIQAVKTVIANMLQLLSPQ